MKACLAVSYLRRSHKTQKQSIIGQRSVINQFAGKNNYTVVKEFVDDGVSGTSKPYSRKSFLKMIEFVEQSKRTIKALLVYDISRFSRSTLDETAYYRYRLRLAGCRVVYIMEQIPEGDSGDLVRSILQWDKHEQVKQRTRDLIRGFVSAIKKGNKLGGPPPFGYRSCYISDNEGKLSRALSTPDSYQNEKTVLEVGPAGEVAIVRRIYSMYAKEGLSFLRIADKLNSERLHGPKSSHWNVSTIRYILTNPAYTGTLCYNRRARNKHYGIKGEKSIESPEINSSHLNPETEWIKTENTHGAIIEKDIFEKAQEIIKHRALKYSSKRLQSTSNLSAPAFLLSNLLYCGHCGSRMHTYKSLRVHEKREYYYSFYRCTGHSKKGVTFCLPHQASSRKLDVLALTLIRNHLVKNKRSVESVQLGCSNNVVLAKKILGILLHRIEIRFDAKKKNKNYRYNIGKIVLRLKEPSCFHGDIDYSPNTGDYTLALNINISNTKGMDDNNFTSNLASFSLACMSLNIHDFKSKK